MKENVIYVSRNGISSIIGKAKKLRREGFPTDQFKEITVVGADLEKRL